MRLKKNFTRKSGLRDAKLIIIATEGEKTEKSYFTGIAYSEKYKNPKVHVEILNRDGGSDPKNCLRALNRFKSEYRLNKNDELWLVCDVDRWGSRKLSEVNQLCKQKGYKHSISNPCFELWLLIHHVKLSDSTDTYKEKISSNCAMVTGELKNILGSYNKANLKISDFIDRVDHALQESRKMDHPSEDWPSDIGTKVFNLVESMLANDALKR